MTTVLMISGSWPPQACGVGDYSEMLCRELERQAVSVMRFASDKLAKLWSPDAISAINEIDCDLVHIQYPTAGYGRSITPSALARCVRGKPVLVTLHEYSVFRWYRRAWFTPFAQNCAARVFTTDDERALFEQRFPARRGVDLTIEIASNIPASALVPRQQGRVCYFGLIAPNKGIEEFLELSAAAAAEAQGLTFELIGAIPERFRRYAEDILKRAMACNIRISLHLPDKIVADRLARATFVYLPFPDGASAKRGTLAAAILNGAIVVTRHSVITPDWIRAVTVHAETPREALGVIVRLQDSDAQRTDLTKRIARSASRFRWDAVTHQHVELYERLLNHLPIRAREVVDVHPPAEERRNSRLAS